MKIRLTATLTYLLFLSLMACGQQKSSFEIDSLFFNGEELPVTGDDYRYRNETVYLATTLLDKHMHLELQELVPDEQIGICTDELCIPYALDSADSEAAYKEGEFYYIPIVNLMESLGSKAVWDNGTKRLTISYKF